MTADLLELNVKCNCTDRLEGKTVVITGGRTDIGKEMARDLYWRGAKVIFACRDLERGNDTMIEIKNNPPSKSNRKQFQGKPGELSARKLDLCNLSSVRQCARKLNAIEPQIHSLINNAEIMMTPKEKTQDGMEAQFQTNYLGHFLFTLLLLPKMKTSGSGCRIINFTSSAHKNGEMNFEDFNMFKSYSPLTAYSQSKLAVVLFTKALDRRLKDLDIVNVSTFVVNSGMLASEFFRNMELTYSKHIGHCMQCFAPLFKTTDQAAQSGIHCAVSNTALRHSGMYFENCKIKTPAAQALNEEDGERLWKESVKLVGFTVVDDFDGLLAEIMREMTYEEPI